MRVHHLNCGTMCPFGGRFISGTGKVLTTARMVCHCLLIESEDGLVLVDSGVGRLDVADVSRLGTPFAKVARPALLLEECAANQVERLGFKVADVRHIVVTHLDLDHAGGISDFPNAKVHVLASEHEAAMRPSTRNEAARYRAVHWAHEPEWVLHTEAAGEAWFGFERVRVLGGVGAEVLLIPLLGHTRGHCGVAVQSGEGWLLHCGDAYFHHREMDSANPGCPVGLELFQRTAAIDGAARATNRERLRDLATSHGHEVRLFSAHSPVEFDRLRDLDGALRR